MAETSLKLLLDTNAFIALEPTSTAVERGLQYGAELARLASENGHRLYLHEATHKDFARDRDSARRSARVALAAKYPVLLSIPDSAVADLVTLLDLQPPPTPGSNDAVDLEMLTAVAVTAVDYLVTDDARLRGRARRAGLAENVLPLAEAVQLLRDLSPRPIKPPPAVEQLVSYQLDARDPIFNSLRSDYPEFDRWFDGVRRAHRTAWTIRHGNERYAGLMLVKDEDDAPYGLSGKVLKVSTLKVIDEAQGRRYGELLLKTLFGHAEHHGHDAIYVTVFEKHTSLVELLTAFGFSEHGHSAIGELVLAKRRRPTAQDQSLDPLQFHTTIGPPAIAAQAPLFVVPVEPRWHDALFPDYPGQMTLLTGESPYGNALRKAYLCNAPTRQVIPGSTLLFYRSHDRPAITVAGVVEDVTVSSIPEEVARYVGRRTVYTLGDIKRLCRSARPVLTLLFRQDRLLEPAWSRRELMAAGVLKSHPQSITKVKTEEGRLWVQERLNEQH